MDGSLLLLLIGSALFVSNIAGSTEAIAENVGAVRIYVVLGSWIASIACVSAGAILLAQK